MVRIRRLGPGDEDVLALLARAEGDFGDDPDVPSRPPTPEAAEYLADTNVLHWVAEEGGDVLGHLLCYVERRRAGAARQVLVYEIGVRAARRREGIGRALVSSLDAWMAATGVQTAWLLADAGAIEFYEACGFEVAAEQSMLMRRRTG